MYYAFRRIFETLPHLPIDNAIGSTNFSLLGSLHVVAVHVLFWNQSQSPPSVRGATNHIPTWLSLRMHMTKLFRFFAFCDGKKCVVFDKKVFLSHFRWAWKLIFIMWHDICQCPDSSLYLRRGVNRGQQIRRSVLIFLQNPQIFLQKPEIRSTVRVVLLAKSADLNNNVIT